MAAPDRQKTRLCSVKLLQVMTLPKAVRSDANDYSARLILYTVSITVELSQTSRGHTTRGKVVALYGRRWHMTRMRGSTLGCLSVSCAYSIVYTLLSLYSLYSLSLVHALYSTLSSPSILLYTPMKVTINECSLASLPISV